MVNDRLICFDKVFEMVMNSSLNVILPPNFINPPSKISTNATIAAPRDNRKRKRGERRKPGKVEGERIVKNPSPSLNS